MDREDIRTLIRVEADELVATDQGLFTNEHLNTLINISQRKLQLKLITLIPWMFRKSSAVDYTISKTSYSIATDLSISDLLMFETILHNKSNQRPTPLAFVRSPNDFWQYGYVGQTGSDPKAWGYLDKDSIAILPIAAATVVDRMKVYYFQRIADLDADDEEPELDESLHDLVAYDVLLRWMIRDKDSEIYRMIQAKGAVNFEEAVSTLTMPQGFDTGRLPGAHEYLDYSALSTNVTG